MLEEKIGKAKKILKNTKKPIIPKEKNCPLIEEDCSISDI